MSDADLARRALALLDLTELGDSAADADVAALCARAKGGAGLPAVAAVCVWPRHVALARGLVGTIPVATVVNFPTGADPLSDVVQETREALAAGADEIDLVLPYRDFLAGDLASAEVMVRTIRAAAKGKVLKVILETGVYPSLEAIRAAADLAIAAGADFIKTSTGKVKTGATPEAARAMLEAIRDSGRAVGLKPSGGIRTLEDARAYLGLADAIMGPDWATPHSFRFGASGLHGALAAVIGGAAAPSGTGY